MSTIADNLLSIKQDLPSSVNLVAVSKFHSNDDILEAYNAGQRIFGESRMQELTQKYETLPTDISWHFIGNLQSNKVKNIVPIVDMIHSVDSWKLLSEINKQAAKMNRIVKCLLEIHIAQEETKQGLSFDECKDLLKENDYKDLTHIQIAGVMGMATFTENEVVIKNEFKSLKSFFDELKNDYFAENNYFREISMGMSNDYKLAIEEGATLIRVGSSIFGARI